MNNSTGRLSFIVIVVGRKQKDLLLSRISDEGAKLINTVYGKGSVKANYLTELLGLIPEENKAVITFLLPDAKIDDMFAMLGKEFGFNNKNSGIAFSIPVSAIAV